MAIETYLIISFEKQLMSMVEPGPYILHCLFMNCFPIKTPFSSSKLEASYTICHKGETDGLHV